MNFKRADLKWEEELRDEGDLERGKGSNFLGETLEREKEGRKEGDTLGVDWSRQRFGEGTRKVVACLRLLQVHALDVHFNFTSVVLCCSSRRIRTTRTRERGSKSRNSPSFVKIKYYNKS